MRKISLAKSVVGAAAVAATVLATFVLAPQSANSAAEAAKTGAAVPPKVRLLTTQQYINTIKYFFGTDLTLDVKFAPLKRTEGLLAAGSTVAGVSDSQVETYQKAAAVVSSQVLAPERRATLMPCTPKSDKAADDSCARKFVSDVTQYLYREPVDKARLDELVSLAGHSASELHDFYAGLQITLESILLSPNLLFVAETEKPDPKKAGQVRLDGYAFATRLSLFLWNAAPDAALWKAAAKGELDSEKGRARIVDQMLASPRLEDGVRALFDDMFSFSDFETLSKDGEVYPNFVGEAVADAREQTLRTVVYHLLEKNGDYRDLFTTRETFISPALAMVYDVPSTPGWHRIEFAPEAHRSGILTHVSFLALHSHPTRTSVTLRGKALRELLLCQKVPPPPANVDFSALNNPKTPFKTSRERVAFHLENPVCAGCHRIMDPMGLALENFDGVGKYRTTESGATIDASGGLDGKSFANVDGLGQALHDHPALPKCLVKRTFGYGVGAVLPDGMSPTIDDINAKFAASGYHLRALLKDIVLNPAFMAAYEPETKQAAR